MPLLSLLKTPIPVELDKYLHETTTAKNAVVVSTVLIKHYIAPIEACPNRRLAMISLTNFHIGETSNETEPESLNPS